jgi:translation initiation factor 6
MITLSSYGRNPNVGVFAKANDKIAFVSNFAPEKFASDIAESMGVRVYRTDVAQISLVGAMIAMNNKGIILPSNTTRNELDFFKKQDLNVGVVEDKHTALGNLVLTNDDGTVISTRFPNKAKKKIADILDTEVATMSFADFNIVGSLGVATSKGALMHPSLSEKDLDEIEKLLKVEVDIGTVNRGIGYIRTGLLANEKGAVIGKETTSPEISRIEDALKFL